MCKNDSENDNFTEVINFEKAREIANTFDLCYTIEYMCSHTAERYGSEFIDEKGKYVYDREEYTEPIIRVIA
ncbi:hypothetical protein FACS1894132_12530 [Clostridia bacterium]|nr:hypothetical protein FACS1894132_12530 [Clostridia bacterium]